MIWILWYNNDLTIVHQPLWLIILNVKKNKIGHYILYIYENVEIHFPDRTILWQVAGSKLGT